jgi:hypothetical protein
MTRLEMPSRSIDVKSRKARARIVKIVPGNAEKLTP